ncbi:MAG: hypothetical protein A3F83_09790 [Candidatus Glassbacteria bacterium RIFCSPLOWO2_12_FULL_58_11]|uniref:histidine kinase n=1 Tax=Candidatus Glassbacteria bacterium RIFCSPLOWO2_12_FULL_58_11 TaxID=1817867 RepID=A0A1F5YZK0_9BACT|nr:MAG: hypothetical protein A3F83_09790 [Candidatus Glassbacteria bacterium RIFCSPLOWO2_12_FULL_58_11]
MSEQPEDKSFSENVQDVAHGPFGFGWLAWRILFWMALIGLGPLLVMAFQGYHCARMAVIERAEAQLGSVVESRKSRIEQWFSEREADMGLIAGVLGDSPGWLKSAAGRDGDSLPSFKIMDEIRRRSPAYETLWFYGLDWRPVFRSGAQDHSDSELLTGKFKEALSSSSKPYFSPVHLHDNGTEYGMHLGCRVSSPRGEALGYAIAYLKISETIDPILSDSSGLGTMGKVYLHFRDENILYTPAEERKVSLNIDPRLGLPLRSGTSAILEYEDFRGRRVLGISKNIPVLNASVIVDLDHAYLFGWLDVLRERALETGSITLVIVLLLAARSSWKLSQPLRELAATARKIAAGRHSERLGPLEGIEAQEVGRAFNKMLDELEASKRRLLHAATLAAVGELSSSIAHEMRNPLSSIRINLQALRCKVEAGPYQELSAIALEQVDRLERMLSELLNFSKPLELAPEPFEFSGLAGQVISELTPQAEEKNVSLAVEKPSGSLLLSADREQIHRALTNLVQNALDAVPPGGWVELGATAGGADNGYAEIRVSDNGPGIRPEDREMIFQPFFTTREGGTGLGLANVKKIVEGHDGKIEVESSPGKGSVFRLLLPHGGKSA